MKSLLLEIRLEAWCPNSQWRNYIKLKEVTTASNAVDKSEDRTLRNFYGTWQQGGHC